MPTLSRKETRLLMGMPVAVEVVGPAAPEALIEDVFAYFGLVDERYSPYNPGSEVAQVNAGRPPEEWSAELNQIATLCRQTKRQTNGYFDAWNNGVFDPSGLVKGWAIRNAAQLLADRGALDFCVEAGGDFQVSGQSPQGGPWRIGLRSPFARDEIIKVVAVTTQGVATSGTAIRGQHIYDPYRPGAALTEVVSLTVIGPDIYEADRLATAAFAMGRAGIEFIESLDGLEGYQVDRQGMATMTSGFEQYVIEAQPV